MTKKHQTWKPRSRDEQKKLESDQAKLQAFLEEKTT